MDNCIRQTFSPRRWSGMGKCSVPASSLVTAMPGMASGRGKKATCAVAMFVLTVTEGSHFHSCLLFLCLVLQVLKKQFQLSCVMCLNLLLIKEKVKPQFNGNWCVKLVPGHAHWSVWGFLSYCVSCWWKIIPPYLMMPFRQVNTKGIISTQIRQK